MKFETFLQVATSILGLAGIAGAAIAVLAAGRRREIDRINAQERSDLRARVDTLEADVGRSKDRERECETKIALQQGQIDTLKELVTQAAAVAELRAATEIHFEAVTDRLEGLQSANEVLLERTRARG